LVLKFIFKLQGNAVATAGTTSKWDGCVTTKSWRNAESEDVEAGVKPDLEVADDLETKEMKTKTLQKPKRVRKPNCSEHGLICH
jgi:hypothetical protein